MEELQKGWHGEQQDRGNGTDMADVGRVALPGPGTLPQVAELNTGVVLARVCTKIPFSSNDLCPSVKMSRMSEEDCLVSKTIEWHCAA